MGLALRNITVLTYLPSIDFIPPLVYFVGVLNDHCQILIDVVQLRDNHNKAIRLNFCVFYFYTMSKPQIHCSRRMAHIYIRQVPSCFHISLL